MRLRNLVLLFLNAGLVAHAVTLVSVSQTAPAGTTITPNGATQVVVTCTYSDSSTTTCNTADSHGNSVTSWADSNSTVATISSGGIVSGALVGSANFTATVTGGVVASGPTSITVATTTLALVSAALSTTGGLTQIPIAATNQIIATCTYSDSSTTNCTTTDIRGAAVTTWASSAPSIATISTSGLATGVSVGTASFTATVVN